MVVLGNAGRFMYGKLADDKQLQTKLVFCRIKQSLREEGVASSRFVPNVQLGHASFPASFLSDRPFPHSVRRL